MSTIFVFGNNVSTTLASGCASGDTTLTLQAGTGGLFPAISAGQVAAVTLEDVSGNLEIAYVTGRTGDVLTVTRGQEGTTALAFASGSRVEMRLTAGILAALLQKHGGDVLNGTTTFSGVLSMGSSGSIQGGEIAGTAVRGTPGGTGNQIIVPTDGASAPYVGTVSTNVILTKGNIATNLPSGFDFVHTNMILYWYGSSGSIPTGWHLCDGTNGTPNLKDQFILGGGGALPPSGGSSSTTTGSTDPSGSLSIGNTTLTIDQIPSHTHAVYMGSVWGYYVNSTQSWRQINVDSGSYQTNFPAGGPAGASGTQVLQSTGGGNAHTHPLAGSLAHTHTYTLPPYVALLAIMKL